MKVNLQTKNLKNFAKSVKNTKLLNFVAITRSENSIIFSYSNYNSLLQYKVDCDYSQDDALDVMVNADNFCKIIKSIKQKEITLEFLEKELKINNFKISCDNNTQSYCVENLDYKLLFEMESGKFLDIIKKLKPAVSNDETRYHLNFINIRAKDGKAIFEATDGRKLFQIRTESKQDFESTNIYRNRFDCFNVFEKDKTIKFYQYDNILVEKDYNGKEYKVNGSKIKIETDNFVVYFIVGDIEFPPSDRVIPNDNSSYVKFCKETLVSILKDATLAHDKGDIHNQVALDILENKLICEVVKDGATVYRAEMDVENNINLTIGLNAKYLISALELFDEKMLNFYLKESLSPVKIETEDRLVVVMPIRL